MVRDITIGGKIDNFQIIDLVNTLIINYFSCIKLLYLVLIECAKYLQQLFTMVKNSCNFPIVYII